MSWHQILKIGNSEYRVEKANNKKHKYVAYRIVGSDLKSPVRFGAYSMPHYKDDVFKQYKELDHNDKKRRELFRKRFRKLYDKNQNNPASAIFWSWRFLW